MPCIFNTVGMRHKLRHQRGKQRNCVEVGGLSPALARPLDRLRALAANVRLGVVFPNSHGIPYREAGLKAMWSKLVKKTLVDRAIGERFTFHDLRVYHVTQLRVQRGTPPDLPANPGATARVYDCTKVVNRESLQIFRYPPVNANPCSHKSEPTSMGARACGIGLDGGGGGSERQA
jgi:hypothetical protein